MTCILCARRGRTTELDTGHVCAVCATRIGDDLAAIPRLAAQASTEPRTGRGSGRTVPASRPPIDLAGIDPALTTVNVGAGPSTVLHTLEAWERLTREERGLTPYGPASMARAALWERRRAAFGASPVSQDPRRSQAVYGTTATLEGCCAFLRSNLPWVTGQPWIDDFADEIRACARALRHLDPDAEPAATVVPCPTVSVDHGDCGQRLRLDSDHVRCPRCGREWDTDQLVRSATSDTAPPDVWVDAEAAARAADVSVSTIRRWAARGIIRRRHSTYRLRDVLAAQTPA